MVRTTKEKKKELVRYVSKIQMIQIEITQASQFLQKALWPPTSWRLLCQHIGLEHSTCSCSIGRTASAHLAMADVDRDTAVFFSQGVTGIR